MAKVIYGGKTYTLTPAQEEEVKQMDQARRNVDSWYNAVNSENASWDRIKSSSGGGYKTSDFITSQNADSSVIAGLNAPVNNNPALPNTGIAGITNQSNVPGIASLPGSGVLPTNQTVLDEYKDNIDELKQAQKEAAIAKLQQARDASLTGLQTGLNSAMSTYNTEESKISPMYYDKRNQVAGNADVAAMNFAQYMAARGIRGAAGGMPGIYRNAGLQNQIGALDRQEAAAKEDLANRRTATQNEYNTKVADINTRYNTDVANVEAGLDAQALQSYINAMEAIRAQAAADNAAMGLTSTGQPTLQGQSLTRSMLESEAQTVALANYDNIQAEIDRRLAVNPQDPLIPLLKAERQRKIDKINAAQAAAEAKAAQAKSEAEQQAWDNALKLWQSNGIATPEIAQILGIPVGSRTADYNLAQLELANKQSSQNNNYLNYSDYYKRGIDMLKETTKSAVQIPDDTQRSGYRTEYRDSQKYTPEDIINWINGLPLTSAEKTRLAYDLGV